LSFFESELRKIVEPKFHNAKYIGRACYVQLSDINRAKIEFVTCGNTNRFEALQMSILNLNDGQVDKLLLRFADVLGKGQVSNLYNQQFGPYVWICDGKPEWYAYKPSHVDYSKIRENVSEYLGVFQSFERGKAKPSIDELIQGAAEHTVSSGEKDNSARLQDIQRVNSYRR